ncbi:MAG TPA: aldo/keto reductase [Candidatus Saccharimonadales bacterium]|nr:aldo/keto reductase [Candidatus Saccharimonadales bacterium]
MAEISAAQAGSLKLGELTVNRLGLGTNRLTDTPDNHKLLQRALELGVNFIDTAHRYQNGASETTIGNALAPFADGLVVATKGGWDNDSLDDIRLQLTQSLQRLKTDHIDLYQLHRINPNVRLRDTMELFREFQDEDKIRHIGLSEVSLEQLKEALEVVPIVSVQNQYNLVQRQYDELVDFCADHGTVFIPWFPLGGLGGDAARVENLLANLSVKYQATPQQLSLAWLLKRSPTMLPIPGTLSIEHLEDNLRAASIELSDADYQHMLSL